ncbi:hypothetical protein [Paucibacter soli]|uniref:hypothetical protein n=1 Tax=Paucibacter soli TaxID=3133433 RepID=UPI0030A37CAC
MKALSRLQNTVLFQAVEIEEVSSKFVARAKTLVAFGVLVAVALASQGAHAQQQGPLTPSNCAMVGTTIGGVLGAASGKTNVQQIVRGALGALGGAAAGNWLCSPKPARSQDSSYAQAANYGYGSNQPGGYAVERQSAKAPLSFSERETLDGMSKGALDAKYEWKKALWQVDQAGQRANGNRNNPGLQSALENEAQARRDFEQRRAVFATTVAKLNNGAEGIEARAVGRYVEISGAMLELSTDNRVSFQMLEARDNQLKAQSQAYTAEANRVGNMRQSNGY